ncbi:general stress protein [Salinicoccus sp. HZC-1]|uniref:general stress protein n=1 Tax=Salinicoccus sp. HZC-1 TaxID=3385497 RepID=UPI00398AC102
MRKIESFGNEQELLGRIEQLKIDGVQEESITVVSNEALNGSSFDYTNVNFKSADGTAWDKIVSYFSSEEPEERVISSLELNDQEEQEYRSELENGRFLLYVNEGGSDPIAKEPAADDNQDTPQQEEKTATGTPTNMTAAGTAGTAGVLGATGATAHDDADRTSTESEIEADTPQDEKIDVSNYRNDEQVNTNGEDGITVHDDTADETAATNEYKDRPVKHGAPNNVSGNTQGNADKNDRDTSSDGKVSQVHNPADEEETDTSKTQEYHDHSEKLKMDDSHMAYEEGTDEHIAVDPSVDTDTQESDMEKIEQHKDPDYLDDSERKPDYGDKEVIVNDDMVEGPRDQDVVDTHNHPELAEEVSSDEGGNGNEKKRQPIDKNIGSKERDYSIKNDVNGEQVISLDREER